MLASSPASILNQNPTDLGIPNRFTLNSSRFRSASPPKADAALVVLGISGRVTGMLNGEWEEIRRWASKP
jgi:hypothetical protein